MSSPTADVLGEVGLVMPVSELAGKTWDVIVVGAGHNGLACAGYLARAGQQVLVIESRARVGGACTIEAPFPAVRLSCRAPPPTRRRRTGTSAARVPVDTGCKRALRSLPRRFQHSTLG